MRGLAGRCRRPRGHRAQRGLCQSSARGVRGRGAVYGDRPHAHVDCGRRLHRQRHRNPRRGFRRHFRGRPGACRRGHRPRRASGLRAAPTRRPRGARWHRGWRRDHVPTLHRGADAYPQGWISSDRRVRRHGGCGRRRRGAQAQCATARRCARHRGLAGFGHHRIFGRRHVDQAPACRLGGAVRNERSTFRTRRDFPGRARYSKACTVSSTPSRTRPRAITAR